MTAHHDLPLVMLRPSCVVTFGVWVCKAHHVPPLNLSGLTCGPFFVQAVIKLYDWLWFWMPLRSLVTLKFWNLLLMAVEARSPGHVLILDPLLRCPRPWITFCIPWCGVSGNFTERSGYPSTRRSACTLLVQCHYLRLFLFFFKSLMASFSPAH